MRENLKKPLWPIEYTCEALLYSSTIRLDYTNVPNLGFKVDMLTATPPNPDMFQPPVNRAMRVLDRSFFRRTIPLAAARVYENSQIAQFRKSLAHDILNVERITSVKPDPDQSESQSERKAILLRPEVKANGMRPGLCLCLDLMQHCQTRRHGAMCSRSWWHSKKSAYYRMT